MFQVAQAFATSIETMAKAMTVAHHEPNATYNVDPQYDPRYGNFQNINNYAGPASFRFQMHHSTSHPGTRDSDGDEEGSENYHQL